MQRRKSGQLRIIAGQWRGRRFGFPATGIRPTPDRVRETLFNWLAPVLDGAHCVDLYAGSGALGLEALSRGAAAVTFVERQSTAVNALQKTLKTLNADDTARIEVVCGDAKQFVSSTNETWDIAFIDPPFHEDLAFVTAAQLIERELLTSDGFIYVETERGAPELAINGLALYREKHHGACTSRLLRRTG